MYLRVYLLGPEGGWPRAIIFRFGRSVDRHRTIGMGIHRPHFITWRHQRWVDETV